MSVLIKGITLEQFYRDLSNAYYMDADWDIAQLSDDVVEVVTCENCKNSYDTFGGLCCTRVFGGYICPSEDFYCRYGEKKGGII